MSLVGLLIAILILVLLLYLIGQLPLDSTAKTVAYVVVVILFILWLARGAGFAVLAS